MSPAAPTRELDDGEPASGSFGLDLLDGVDYGGASEFIECMSSTDIETQGIKARVDLREHTE